jgi:hypothetical protein
MKKRKISTAAFLAGVTTLAVSLPAMATPRVDLDAKDAPATTQAIEDYINGEDFSWIDLNDNV